MKSFKLLLFSLSLCITLLVIYIVQFVIPYKLLFREWFELSYLVLFLVLMINSLFCIIIKWIINYCITSKLNIKITNTNSTDKVRSDTLPNNYNYNQGINYTSKQQLLENEYLFIPTNIIFYNNKPYKVIHKFRTDLSDKDIYGTKWDYLFIKEL